MEKITSAAELKIAIQKLELEQEIQGQQLKEKFLLTYESLKPVNLLKNTINDITSSPHLIDNLLGSVIGLFTGFLSKKIIIGSSGSPFKKLLGSVLQFGVTNFIAQHPDAIKWVGQFIMERFFYKRDVGSEKS